MSVSICKDSSFKEVHYWRKDGVEISGKYGNIQIAVVDISVFQVENINQWKETDVGQRIIDFMNFGNEGGLNLVYAHDVGHDYSLETILDSFELIEFWFDFDDLAINGLFFRHCHMCGQLCVLQLVTVLRHASYEGLICEQCAMYIN